MLSVSLNKTFPLSSYYDLSACYLGSKPGQVDECDEEERVALQSQLGEVESRHRLPHLTKQDLTQLHLPLSITFKHNTVTNNEQSNTVTNNE